MASDGATWTFCDFGLLVTGDGEEQFLPRFFGPLEKTGRCKVRVIGKIPQLRPRSSSRKRIKVIGTNKFIPDKDFEKIGIRAREYLNRQREPYKRPFVILIDDLEHSGVDQAPEIFKRYRDALDAALLERKHLAAVHFLVNMLEAYYFAHAAAINSVLGTELPDYDGDVEQIRHPKNDLKTEAKQIGRSFDEVEHGQQIVERLDVFRVLSRPDACASLRTLFSWCVQAMGEAPTSPPPQEEVELTKRCCLETGVYSVWTGPQLRSSSAEPGEPAERVAERLHGGGRP